MIIDIKVILKNFLDLVDLTKTQALCTDKLKKIIIVYKDDKLVFAIFHIVALSFKKNDNSYNVLIVGLVSNLVRDYI